jgi:hypothetical protein
MGATVVDGSLTAANWAKAKPKDYKNSDLDKALSAWETASKASATKATVPSKLSIKAYEAFVKDAKALVAVLKDWQKTLAAVISAASKCSQELDKMSKKTEDPNHVAYFEAAGVASAIGNQAQTMKAKLA